MVLILRIRLNAKIHTVGNIGIVFNVPAGAAYSNHSVINGFNPAGAAYSNHSVINGFKT
jgi:hypothetical protein